MPPLRKPSRREVLASGLSLSLIAAAPGEAAAPDAIRLFDGQLHLVSDDLKRYPKAPGRDAPGADAPTTPPGAGASVQIGKPHTLANAERGLSWMDEAGVEAAAAIQRSASYGFDNSYILDSADAHPQRYRAVLVVDQRDAATPDRLRDLVATRKIAGLRLTGSAEGGVLAWLRSEAALRTWAAAERLGIVMDVLYTPRQYDAPALDAFVEVARKFPRVPVVVDDMGWPKVEGAPGYGFADLPAGLVEQKNLHFKFTTGNLDILKEANIPAPAFLRHAVDRLGAGRVLWGSDVGISAGGYGEMVQRARDAVAALTPAEQRQVLRETGLSLFARGGAVRAEA
jgi:predicted TIM-barrel fold metal-dependent hydrolase